MPFERALKAGSIHEYDYVTPYVEDLQNVIDMEAIAGSGLRIGVGPPGRGGRGLLGSHRRALRPFA